MSDFKQAAAMMVIGGIAGIGGFAVLTHESNAEATTPAAVTAPAPQLNDEPEMAEIAEEPERAPDVVTVSTRTTGSIESQRPGDAFAVFLITSSDDVADVALVITPGSGTQVDEVVALPSNTAGDVVTIDVGDLAASEERRVVVAFDVARGSGTFTTRTVHHDLHGERARVTSQPTERAISSKLRDADVYETVRRAYSARAIERARELRDEQQWDDARAWIGDAYANNVEVGMAMRITGALAGYQSTLGKLRDEIDVLSRPKPRPKARPKAPGIVVQRGDRRS